MLTKKYIKSRDIMKVTFRVDFAPEANAVEVAGDFNGWQPQSLQRLKGGDFKLDLELEPGRAYQYRYRIDGRWQNDWQADGYAPNGLGHENSIALC